MHLKRLVAVALVGGLILGSVGVADAKKKKKKPPVKTPVTFYLRAEACADETYYLSIVDGEDGGTCSTGQDGLLNEVAHATGEEYSSKLWIGTDGFPFTLDATSPLTGDFYITSFAGVSAGPAILDVVFEGERAGEVIEIASTTVEYDVDPQADPQQVTFEIDVDDALDKTVFSTLQMTTTSRGEAPLQGYFEMEEPASNFVMPTLVKP